MTRSLSPGGPRTGGLHPAPSERGMPQTLPMALPVRRQGAHCSVVTGTGEISGEIYVKFAAEAVKFAS